MSNCKRIVILVNKDFEYKGFIEGLRDIIPVYSGTNGRDAECRFNNLVADIYCIQNLFKKDENSSNSEVKYDYLKELFKSNVFRLEDCNGILSFSTSESTPFSQGADSTESKNGCVYIGNKFFLSDQIRNDKNTWSNLDIGNKHSNYTEFYTKDSICNGLYECLNKTNMNLKPAYKNSASYLRCIAGSAFVCIGVVNVMNYSCYKKADKSAYEQFRKKHYSLDSFPISIETTHGVVVKALKDTCKELKLKKDIPVNFISPIVDRYLKFDNDVDGKEGKQNFICSYNGGIVTGYALQIMNTLM